jgi:small subunit ribosomal protein S4e
VPKQEVVEHLKLEKGALIHLTGGKHTGDQGTVDAVEGKRLWYRNTQGERVETLTRFAFVVGKGEPAVTL